MVEMLVMSVYLLHSAALSRKKVYESRGSSSDGGRARGLHQAKTIRLYRQKGTPTRSQSAELPKVSLRTPGQVQ